MEEVPEFMPVIHTRSPEPPPESLIPFGPDLPLGGKDELTM